MSTTARTGCRIQPRAAAALATLLVAQLAGAAAGASPAAAAARTDRVSVVDAGQTAGVTLEPPAVGDGGRYVAFSSTADLLDLGVEGEQVYVRDRTTNDTTLVSVRTGGRLAGPGSERPAMSADGRFVAFSSTASDLVRGDTNGVSDVFVHDRVSGSTSRVSVSIFGAQGDGPSFEPTISADGRFVAFESDAATLVSGDTNGVRDVFLHDRRIPLTLRVSKAADGAEGNAKSENPSISADGSRVAFQSAASNLVAGDTGGVTDVFVRSLPGGLVRASVASSGAGGNGNSLDPSISADGSAVVYESSSSDLTAGPTAGRRNVFHHDLRTRRTTRISKGTSGTGSTGDSREPSISADGRMVAFKSTAPDLVPVDTNGSLQDVFVADLDLPLESQNTLVSISRHGSGADGLSTTAVITAQGGAVAFTSTASNLVVGDTNGAPDTFVRQLQ